MTSPSVRDAVADPEWIPHTFDLQGANLTFVHVPRAARKELMFLSEEHFAGDFDKATFPAAAVQAQAQAIEPAPIQFIFHTSFCCSTLLARALDVQGTSVLKEPDVLINLANRIIRSDDQVNRQRVDLVLRLLQRPFTAGETVIVKPTNFANRLLDVVLAQRPQSKAVLLYSDLETFLRSLLKRGIWGRILGRKLFNQLSGWSSLRLGYGAAELFELTDVQVAAVAWLMQVQHFDMVARAFGPRAIVLDSATLLAQPADSIDKTQALFGLGLSRADVEAIASGPVFSKHSKFSDRDYSAEERERDHASTSAAYSEELEMVAQWIKAVATQLGAPLRPGS